MKPMALTAVITTFATLLLATCPASAGDGASVFKGRASYYANSLHGNKTASGARYDKNAFTAAHRKLKFGTKVKVTYIKTGKSVIVTINDRGPFAKGRVIDLSRAAAKQIGLIKSGHGKVTVAIMP
jgi:rare lipoprotein A